jgi:PucR C-terminal helix-turn-helix domain
MESGRAGRHCLPPSGGLSCRHPVGRLIRMWCHELDSQVVRALVRYVSKVDTHTESALRVIAYFDALVEHRATLEACVRAAAGLSQCAAGLRDEASTRSIRFNQRGVALDGMPVPTTSRPVRIADRDVGEVWLERDDNALPLDELVVERMALAVGVLWRTSTRPSRSIGSLIENVLAAGSSDEERAGALRLLGLVPDRPTDVFAVASRDTDGLTDAIARVRELIRERDGAEGVFRSAVLGNVGAVLRQRAGDGGDNVPLPRLLGLRVGISHANDDSEIPEVWPHAQIAARFCGLLGFGNQVAYDELGSLAALAHVPPPNMDSNPDVRALIELESTTRGKATIRTLEKWLASRSRREAAAALHLHHSSVGYQLSQAEKALGLDLEEPRGRLRAELAVMLWRMSAR